MAQPNRKDITVIKVHNMYTLLYPKYFYTAHTTVCSKILIIEELAKYQQMYPEFNTDCSNQISASNLIVKKLCPSVPVTQIWKPGFKVPMSYYNENGIQKSFYTGFVRVLVYFLVHIYLNQDFQFVKYR